MPHAIVDMTNRATRPGLKCQAQAKIARHIIQAPADHPGRSPPTVCNRSTWIDLLESYRREQNRPAEYRHNTAYTASHARFPPDLQLELVEFPLGERSLPHDSHYPNIDPRDPASGRGGPVSTTGSPISVSQRPSVVADCVASVRLSGIRASEPTDRSVPPIQDSLIGPNIRCSVPAQRRLSDSRSSSFVRRPLAVRRDSAAAALGPSHSNIRQSIAGTVGVEASPAPQAIGGFDANERSNCLSIDSDPLRGLTDDDGLSTVAAAPDIKSTELKDSESSMILLSDEYCAKSRSNALVLSQLAEGSKPSAQSCVESSGDGTNSDSLEAPHDATRATTALPSVHPVTASSEHKQLLCFLAEWAADYVWKVVTTGSKIDAVYRGHHLSENLNLPAAPPSYLADAIKGCLLATLLQPSAIFLALWYIVRLPVFIGEAAYEPDTTAYHFRRVLLGEGVVPFGSTEKQNLELYSPFKLFVTGLLLASKTLDDHTYSNRCWHEVSRIQIRDINSLELYSLDLLRYDLTVPHGAWSQWLATLRAYHRATAPYPTPIGPARDTPHSVILHLLDRLIAVSTAGPASGTAIVPVFFPVSDSKKQFTSHGGDADDWDPDEDGPMKDEHRRPRAAAAQRLIVNQLPPPAAWSPAADPPLDVNRRRPKYLAVQKSPSLPTYPATQLISGFPVAPCTEVVPIYQYLHPFAAPGAPRMAPAQHHQALLANLVPHDPSLCLPTALWQQPLYMMPCQYEVHGGAFCN